MENHIYYYLRSLDVNKKKKDIGYINVKKFKDLVYKGLEYSIVGRTKLKKAKKDAKTNILVSDNNKYKIGKYNCKNTKGYIPVGSNKYIEYVGGNLLLLKLIFPILLLVLGSYIAINPSNKLMNLIKSNYTIEAQEEVEETKVLDKALINIDSNLVTYQKLEEDKIDKDIEYIKLIIVDSDLNEHIILNKKVNKYSNDEYYFNLDYEILDMELVPGVYEGKTVFTYDNGDTQERDNITVIYKSNEGNMEFIYNFDVTIDLQSKNIDIYYKNDVTNIYDCSVEVILKGDNNEFILGTSDTIKPGESLNSIKLNELILGHIEKGTYKGFMRVYFDTSMADQSAQIYTDIDVDITIK